MSQSAKCSFLKHKVPTVKNVKHRFQKIRLPLHWLFNRKVEKLRYHRAVLVHELLSTSKKKSYKPYDSKYSKRTFRKQTVDQHLQHSKALTLVFRKKELKLFEI